MNLINLMPHRHLGVQRRRRRFRAAVGLCVAAAGAVVGGASFALERLLEQQQSRNAVLDQARVSMQQQAAQARRLQDEIEALQRLQAKWASLRQHGPIGVSILKDLARLTPAGVVLSHIRQNDHKLMVSGVAASQKHLSRLIAELQHDAATLHQAELVEMRSSVAAATSKDIMTERHVEFVVSAVVRRQAWGGEGPP